MSKSSISSNSRITGQPTIFSNTLCTSQRTSIITERSTTTTNSVSLAFASTAFMFTVSCQFLELRKESPALTSLLCLSFLTRPIQTLLSTLALFTLSGLLVCPDVKLLTLLSVDSLVFFPTSFTFTICHFFHHSPLNQRLVLSIEAPSLAPINILINHFLF